MLAQLLRCLSACCCGLFRLQCGRIRAKPFDVRFGSLYDFVPQASGRAREPLPMNYAPAGAAQ
eukprot:12079317-Karenia_brevis.AAC.1